MSHALERGYAPSLKVDPTQTTFIDPTAPFAPLATKSQRPIVNQVLTVHGDLPGAELELGLLHLDVLELGRVEGLDLLEQLAGRLLFGHLEMD